MKRFNIGQRVRTPNGREGVIKSFDPSNPSVAIIWHTEDGTDVSYMSISTLTKITT